MEKTKSKLIGKFCIVRTYSAGVFAGVLTSLDGKIGEVENARRVWYWDGAASLSELSIKGANPQTSKIPEPVKLVHLTEIIEIIPCEQQAIKFFKDCPVWKKQ